VKQFKTVAIVSTGTEILQGMYADTNAQWLAQRLCGLGLRVVAETAAPDDAACVESALRFAARRADLVICSGGLGPTGDDVNCEILSRVFGAKLVYDNHVHDMIVERFSRRGVEVPTGNDKQSYVPEGASVFYNDWGTAPGWFLSPADERGVSGDDVVAAAAIALPGPPKELKPMFDRYVPEILAERLSGDLFVRTHTLHIYGYPESEIGTYVSQMFRARSDVDFTILARPMGIDLRITGHAATVEALDALIDEVERETVSLLPRNAVYGTDNVSLAEVVGDLLKSRGEWVSTAESCTGGLISKFLTDVPGSSSWFECGYVTYANSAKMLMLDVSADTLSTYGAVSEETAREMAASARRLSGTDYALATTGIAGPGGGSDTKPVGLVYIALATSTEVIVKKQVFLFDRELNRVHAALTALNMLRGYMMEHPVHS